MFILLTAPLSIWSQLDYIEFPLCAEMLFVSPLKPLVTHIGSRTVLKCYLCSMPSILLLRESQSNSSSQVTFTTSDLVCMIAVVPECG